MEAKICNEITEIILGGEYFDKITGVAGVAVELTTSLYDNDRVALQPIELYNGRPQEWIWLSVDQVSATRQGRG